MYNQNQKFNRNNTNNFQGRTRINEHIRCYQVMVVKEEQKLGIMTPDEARRIAREEGLDLVEVAPQAKPPVCRIMDFGKFKYEQGLKEKEQKKKQKNSEAKGIRLSPGISEHDLDIKLNSAKKFLEEGHRVHFRLIYERRENAHKDLGFKVVERIISELAEHGVPHGQAKLDGNNLNCIIEPKSK